MAIHSVELKDFLVFKGEFVAEFCPGVNIIIGSNGTGKTTLLKSLDQVRERYDGRTVGETYKIRNIETGEEGSCRINHNFIKAFVYIPEKDILEHSKGLLTFMEQKDTGFSVVYKNVLVAAQDIPTKTQTITQKAIGEKISTIIGGHVEWVQDEGIFYTIKIDGKRIPFTGEASGYKKLGFLGLLVASGQLESGTVLFWDEPENSLNPELIPILVDILLELSRNGIQIFIATHSELLASYFAVNRQKSDKLLFLSLYKDGEQIKVNANNRFDLLEPNNLSNQPIKLYEKEIEKGLGGNE